MTGVGAVGSAQIVEEQRATWTQVLGGVLLSLATMLAIGGLALLVLLTPLYMHPALDLSGAPSELGMRAELAYRYSDRTVAELLLGPATFAYVAPDGTAFYGADEIGHLRDVRALLLGFLAVSVISGIVIFAALARRRHDGELLTAIARGGVALAAFTLVVGVFAALAFSAAFELFHELFFPGGNWSFDPTSQRLVQLYPLRFWQLTTAALGVLLAGGGIIAAMFARRQARGRR